MFKQRFFLTLTFLFFYLTAAAQTDSTFLTRAANTLQKQPPTEKVYLHVDKPNYDFGDTIWYKAYAVIGHHQLSVLSRVLYVELISPEDTLVTRQVLQLADGIAWGEIPLPRKLKQGNYLIRAYTNWMRNAGAGYFFSTRVRLGGLQVSSPETQNTTITPDVQFFPEGGQLVNGIRSKVAVKVVGHAGQGIDIQGEIDDNAGNAVAGFATQHLGMGVFAFTPQTGKLYTAKISGPGGHSYTENLPVAQEEGFTLAVNNSQPDSLLIKVAVNDKTLVSQKNNLFYIIAQSSGKIYYTSTARLDRLGYAAKIAKARFLSGIMQFTLFSQSGEPLAERIAFMQNNDTLKLSMAMPVQNYTTRQHVKISLLSKDNNDNPVPGSFSVAVINESQTGTDENNESTILNNLLLTADLKGHIEQPGYYFSNINSQTRADLDVLMLTQGYRRFVWKAALNNNGPAITYQPEKSLELEGSLKTPDGKAVPNGKISLVYMKQSLLKDTTTDAAGNFKFGGIFLTDTARLMLRAKKDDKSDDVVIEIKQPVFPNIVKTDAADTATLLPPQLTAIMLKKQAVYQQEQQYNFIKNGIDLKQVEIKGRKERQRPDLSGSANLNGGGNADQVILANSLVNCQLLTDCLTGIFNVKFSVNGTAVNTRNKRPMSLIIDGNIADGTNLNDIDPSQIYSIEVLASLTNTAVYGASIKPGGALVITLKRGSAFNEAHPGFMPYAFNGFYKARAFYVPKYNSPVSNKQLTDMRSTIYWEPNVITGKDGKAAFEYFNNDTKGTYRIVIEGIDDNGNLGRMVFRYKVE